MYGASIQPAHVAIALALGVAALLVVFAKPRAAALIALALGMLQYGPTKTVHLLPAAFTVVDDALLVALAVRWVVDVALRRARPPVWVLTPLLIWVGVGIIGLLARGIDVRLALSSFRWMFLPAVLCMVCAHYALEERFAVRVLQIIIGVGMLQAGVAILQAGFHRSIGDSSYGLLGPGGANALGFIVLLAMVLVAADDRPLSRSIWLVIAGAAGIVAAQSRAAILVMPFALMVTYRRRLKRPVAVLVAAVIVLAVGSAVVVAFEVSHMPVTRDLSPLHLVAVQLQSPDTGGGRLVPLRHLPHMFGGSVFSWAGGLGPSQYGSAFRPIKWMAHYSYQIANSEWTVIVGEYGLVGLICFLAILSRFVLIALRPPDDDAPDWMRQVRRAAPAIMMVAAVGMTVMIILEYQPFSYAFWALLGLVEAMFLRSNAERGGARRMISPDTPETSNVLIGGDE
jgi:O-Antigen ligase